MTTPNLAIAHLVANQANAEVPVNDQADKLDVAMNDTVDIVTTAGGTISVSNDDFRQNYRLNLTGSPGAAFILQVPNFKRSFSVKNNSGQSATVQTAGAATTQVIDDTEVFSLYGDGSDNITTEGGGASGPIDDLSDVDTTTTAPVSGDHLEWDGANWVPAAVGSTTVGSILSGRPGTWEEIKRIEISAGASEVDLTWDNGDGWDEIEVIGLGVKISADNELQARLSTDGGATFKSGATDYKRNWRRRALGSFTSGQDNPSVMGVTTSGGGATADETVTFCFSLFSPADSAVRTTSICNFAGHDSAGDSLSGTWASVRLANEAHNAVRFFPSVGTFSSGTLILRGRRSEAAATAKGNLKGALVEIGRNEISGSPSNVDFTWSNANDYDEILIRGDTIKPSTDAEVLMQLSDNGGASWKTGATDYRQCRVANVNGVINLVEGDAASMSLTPGSGGASADEVMSFQASLVKVGDASVKTMMLNQYVTVHSSGNSSNGVSHGFRKANEAHDGVRLSLSSGTFSSGTVIIYGRPKLGVPIYSEVIAPFRGARHWKESGGAQSVSSASNAVVQFAAADEQFDTDSIFADANDSYDVPSTVTWQYGRMTASVDLLIASSGTGAQRLTIEASDDDFVSTDEIGWGSVEGITDARLSVASGSVKITPGSTRFRIRLYNDDGSNAVTVQGYMMCLEVTGMTPVAASWEELDRQEASASAQIDLAFDPTIYDEIEVSGYEIVAATDAVDMHILTSSDGSTFDVGASDYGWAFSSVDDAGSTSDTGAATDTKIKIGAAIGNAAGEFVEMTLHMKSPGNTLLHKLCRGTLTWVTNVGKLGGLKFYGRRQSTSVIKALRIKMSSGNITSGTFVLRARRKP
jgi:hypothetical protein